jgi:hypothetical protein
LRDWYDRRAGGGSPPGKRNLVEFPRIPLLGTSVDKGKKKGRAEASWEEVNARGPEPSMIAHDKRPGNTSGLV